MIKILIVDDEKPICDLIDLNLSAAGYFCKSVQDGMKAIELIEKETFDLILLDIMLPGVDGFDIMEYIRPLKIPVIFITAKGDVKDRVKGLRLGAEDYIVKPFEILELLARVEAVLRRVHAGAEVFDLGDCHVEFGTHRVFVAGHEVALTPQEFMLLGVLVRNRNLALSREKLLQLAWGYDYEGDTRTVDVHIQKLRKKLGFEDRIQTVYKLGYRLSTKE